MSAKQVTFGSRPQARPEPTANPEQWVESRTAEEQHQRRTFDGPASRHRRVMRGGAQRGVTIRAGMLALLEREVPG